MGKRCLALVICVLLGGFCLVAQEKRTALLVANGTYASFSSLANPVPEARELKKVLEGLGFSVTLVEHASRNAMVDALADFEDSLKKRGGIALFHYGGHAVEEGGKNYLIPVDADIPDPRRIASRTVAVDEVLASMEGRSSTSIVILDSCRNNPLPAGAGRSASRGLALIAPPPNTAVVYAAQAGAVARDGLFTPLLCRYLAKPGLSLQEVLTSVRKEVFDKSGGAQTPGTYDQLFEALYLAGPPAAAAGATLAQGPNWRWVQKKGQAPGPAPEVAQSSADPVYSFSTPPYAVGSRGVLVLQTGYKAPGAENESKKAINRLLLWAPGTKTWEPVEPAAVKAQSWQGEGLFPLGDGWARMRSMFAFYIENQEGLSSGYGTLEFKMSINNSRLAGVWQQQLAASSDSGRTDVYLEQVEDQIIRVTSSEKPGQIEEYDGRSNATRILDPPQSAKYLLGQAMDYHAVSLGNTLYLVGMVPAPVNFGAQFPVFAAFDAVSHTFSYLSPGFSSRNAPGVGAWNGSLVIAGGLEPASNRPSDEVNIYHPSSSSWKSSTLKVPRGAPLVVVRDGKLHVLGGKDKNDQPLKTMEIYDDASNTWRQLADLPLAISSVSHMVAGDTIIAREALPDLPQSGGDSSD